MPPGRSFPSTGGKYSSCMASAAHARDTTGGAVIGASAITTVLSVLPPRIMPPYSPRNVTSRASTVAARASTCAASWTPWPPMPVMSTSRSTDSPETKRHQVPHLVGMGTATARDRVVHARQHEVADERRVLARAAERAHRRPQGLDELAAGRGEFVGKAVGESGAVQRERAGRFCGAARPRLGHHSLDPAAHLLRRIRVRADSAAQIVDELPLTVGQDREQERILRREVLIKRLIRQSGRMHDVADRWVDVARVAHDSERSVDESPHLARVGLPPPGEGLVGQLVLEAIARRNNVLHFENTIPAAGRNQPPARSRSAIRVRWTCPVAAVRGSASTTVTRRGCFDGASRPAQNSRSASTSGAAAPARTTTTAVTTSPHSASGRPMTATSPTSGCAASTCSTSTGAIVSPPLRITSRARPTIDR